MHNRVSVLGMTLPEYGVMAVFGIVIIRLLGIVTVWHRKQEGENNYEHSGKNGIGFL